jgi:hypothetical protein
VKFNLGNHGLSYYEKASESFVEVIHVRMRA